MGRRHEPPASGLGTGGSSGSGGGGGTDRAATLHLAPCSGSCTGAATPFLPSLLLSTSPDTAPSILTLPSSTP